MVQGVWRLRLPRFGSGSFGVRATNKTTGLLRLTGLVCSDKLAINNPW
jgi:hypothetical protein